jgi:hypothetical protein
MSVQEDKETIIKLLGVIGGGHTIKCMSYFKNKQTGTNFHWRHASEHMCKVKAAEDEGIKHAAAELLKEGRISKTGSYYFLERSNGQK